MITIFGLKIMTNKKYNEINNIKKDIRDLRSEMCDLKNILIKKGK